MRKLVLWLIRVFRLDIPAEKVVEKAVEKEVYLPKDGVIDGDITIKGDVLVTGKVFINGSITILGAVNYGLKFDGSKED